MNNNQGRRARRDGQSIVSKAWLFFHWRLEDGGGARTGGTSGWSKDVEEGEGHSQLSLKPTWWSFVWFYGVLFPPLTITLSCWTPTASLPQALSACCPFPLLIIFSQSLPHPRQPIHLLSNSTPFYHGVFYQPQPTQAEWAGAFVGENPLAWIVSVSRV